MSRSPNEIAGAEELLTTREAAALLGVGTTSIKRWADAGLLACVKTPGGHRRFPRAVVESFVANGDPEAAVETSDRVGSWIRLLVSGPGGRSVADRLHAEKRQMGSWFKVADAMHPVIEEIGRRWARGEITVIQEHVASERLARGLAQCADAYEPQDSAPRALLIAAEGDDHTLGLSLLELCLRANGWKVTWAGRMTPIHFVAEFIATEDADMIAVSASSHSRDAAMLADQARRLGEACADRGVLLVLGGSGLWPEQPSYGHRLRSFTGLEELFSRDRSLS